MANYEKWRLDILSTLVTRRINHAYIGDTVTCIDDFGHRTGSIDLIYAWDNDLSINEVITVLTGEA